ncbi:APC family permease [Pseudonocardia spinosispora]|uniref:APC family permease n=1 Tax=Pseudonocardia spinosispora TaxID=103441 RepID=UPI00041F583A|nr:APC family permease [Pseudonocardia spinosispora]
MSADNSQSGLDAPDRPGTGFEQMHRKIGFGGLLFAAMASMIGSGWLFGPLNAAKYAGPLAIVAWPLAAVLFGLLALCYSELGAMFPVSGGVVRFPQYAFGQVAGAVVGWIVYVGAVTFPAIEVEAALQYATNYLPWLTHKVTEGDTSVVVLTGPGFGVAALMMVLFTIINLYGVQVFVRANNAIMVFKLFVMFAVAVAFFATAFHVDRLTDFGGFAPEGVSGLLTAIASGGVAFAFTGFQQPVAVAGEVTNPGRNVPRAMMWGLAITSLLYCLLELAFLCGLPTEALAQGWAKVGFENDFGPLAGLATLLGLGWLAALLYIDAIVSPADCGLNWAMMNSRISYGMAENGTAPAALARLSRRGVPWIGVLVGSVIGLVLFLPFPGWQTFVGFITSAAVLSYGTGPIAHAALRRQLPDQDRPFRTLGGDLVPFLAFYAANLIVFWTGWNTVEKLLIAAAIGIVLFVVQQTRATERAGREQWIAAGWVLPWLVGLGVISYFGTFDGGTKALSFEWSFVAVLVLSAVVYALAVRTRLPRALVG